MSANPMWQSPLDPQDLPRFTAEQMVETMQRVVDWLAPGHAHVPVKYPSSKRLAPRWQVPAIRYTQACKRLGGAPPHFMETPWKSWSALKARMANS
jgi:hypothetical protein